MIKAKKESYIASKRVPTMGGLICVDLNSEIWFALIQWANSLNHEL